MERLPRLARRFLAADVEEEPEAVLVPPGRGRA